VTSLLRFIGGSVPPRSISGRFGTLHVTWPMPRTCYSHLWMIIADDDEVTDLRAFARDIAGEDKWMILWCLAGKFS